MGQNLHVIQCDCGTGVEIDVKKDKVLCPNCVNRQAAPPAPTAKEKAAMKAEAKEAASTTPPKEAPVKLNKDGTPRKKKGEGVPYVKKMPGAPRGWHLKKEYIHTDGRKFERGKEVK